jgi:hypothetical protein
MILQSIQNSTFNQQVLRTIPDNVQVLLNTIKLKKYEELYELEADGTASLEDDLRAVIAKFSNGNESLNHLRYMWMTLILSLAVEPTLQYYDPDNSLPQIIIQLLEEFLRKTINSSNKTINITPDKLDKLINEIFKSHESYFHKQGANFQAISEALDVFYNALKVIKYDQSVESILEILDDCLEGSAIFPGSYGRRELFDWWLLDVVPESYKLLPPKSFYVVEGVKNKEEIKLRQTNLLDKISKEIRSSIPEFMLQSPIAYNKDIFSSPAKPAKMNIGSFVYGRKINYQSKITQLV